MLNETRSVFNMLAVAIVHIYEGHVCLCIKHYECVNTMYFMNIKYINFKYKENLGAYQSDHKNHTKLD